MCPQDRVDDTSHGSTTSSIFIVPRLELPQEMPREMPREHFCANEVLILNGSNHTPNISSGTVLGVILGVYRTELMTQVTVLAPLVFS